MKKEVQNKLEEFEEAIETHKKDGKYVLRLFVAGINPKSKKAIENLREVCEENLKDQYDLEIIDIYQQPIFAREGKIVAAPTLSRNYLYPFEDLWGSVRQRETITWTGLKIPKKIINRI